VLFHADEQLFPLGYLGVDVFFVISGFVVMPLINRIYVSHSIGDRVRALGSFYRARFFRLAPALVVTLIVSAVIIFLLGPPSDHNRFARQGLATLFLVGNFGAFRYSGDYFSPNPNPLVHTWSLSVEEQIYVVLPVLLLLIVLHRIEIKKIITIALLLISAISFTLFLFPALVEPIYALFTSHYNGTSFAFYSPISRIWQFTLGGLGFLLIEKNKNQCIRLSIRIRVFLVLMLVVFLFGPVHLNFGLSSIVATLGTLFIILTKSLELIPKNLIRLLAWTGDRSYSIYLVHMPLLYIAKYSPAVEFFFTESRILQSAIAVILSIYFGTLSYETVETRFRTRNKSRGSGFKTISVGFIFTLVIPALLFVGLDRGSSSLYWGLNKNISPPVEPVSLDKDCSRTSNIGPPCFYPTPKSTRTVLLLGDSHAGALSQAVIEAGRKQNWNVVVWTAAGCRVNFNQRRENPADQRCINQNVRKLAWVKTHKPNLVIVAQYVQKNESKIDVRDALKILKENVPSLLLIETTPVFPDGKDFMVDRPLFMTPYKPPRFFALEEMKISDKEASNQLAIWARYNEIYTMNFDSLFCDSISCSRYDKGEWLYRDNNHLSVVGARLTIPQLEDFLR
jgi:peptidoglycan/LPS O-acetylase OafA/YrhL